MKAFLRSQNNIPQKLLFNNSLPYNLTTTNSSLELRNIEIMFPVGQKTIKSLIFLDAGFYLNLQVKLKIYNRLNIASTIFSIIP